MTATQTAAALVRLYNTLLAMTAEEKRITLDTLGAPENSHWTITQKSLLLMKLVYSADTLRGLAQQMAQTFTTNEQRFLGLDILREPIQVITLDRIARQIGAEKRRAKNIEAGTGAHYLAFTFSDKDGRRINGLLNRIGQQVEEIKGRPEDLGKWETAVIQNGSEARFNRMMAKQQAGK